MSKAEKVYKVVHTGNKHILLSHDKKKVANFLRRNCRFHNNKASYIVEARKRIDELKKLSKNGVEARDFLVKNIKGLSYKEASHFLRNIGYKNLAIIDSHILNSLKELKVLRTNKRPKNREEYLKIEEKIKKFSQNIKIPMDELDLLLWSMKTGKVLK